MNGTTTGRPVVSRPELRRGARWFSALAHALEGSARDRAPLQHCLQFYSCYAESGDVRYLNLCEDFLKYAIKKIDLPPVRSGSQPLR